MDADDNTDESENVVPDTEDWTLHVKKDNTDFTRVDNDILFTGKIGSVSHAIDVRMYYEGPGVRTIPNIQSGGLDAYPIYMNKIQKKIVYIQ